MGTNYDLYIKSPCKCCGREYDPLHIGKSSAGWCFALHIIPEQGINDLEDWRKLWKNPESEILNEYGQSISPKQMEEIITERKWENNWDDFEERHKMFYSSEQQFHERNHSQRGPKGLLRSKIDNYHCIKHGEGTWDCILGEFS